MNKRTWFALLLLTVLSVYSCGDRNKYVLAEVVEIEYWGDVEEGEWIMIDGMKFHHVSNNQTEGCDINYTHGYMEVNEAAEDDKLYLPSTSYTSCLDQDNPVEAKLTRGDMAVNLISALNEFADYADGSLELPYKNTSNVYFTTVGKLRLERSNGEKIRVSTSENYKAAIRKVTEQTQ